MYHNLPSCLYSVNKKNDIVSRTIKSCKIVIKLDWRKEISSLSKLLRWFCFVFFFISFLEGTVLGQFIINLMMTISVNATYIDISRMSIHFYIPQHQHAVHILSVF